MSDALPLPPRPNLEQYRKIARDLQHACNSPNAGAVRDWAARWVEAIARLRGVEITPEVQSQIGAEADRMAHRWRKFVEKERRVEKYALADAQFFVARGHGFASWPRFTHHLEGLARENSPVAKFESAADAIVNGDLKALSKLLDETPSLVHERSTRDHRSTLLHYVSANGIEDFRQKTPGNIVEIARLLLDAGADVNAESDAYRGRSTTLGLTATSCHPENAGVQLPLMQLLIDRGAVIDGPDGGSAVNDCLHNGRGAAAEFLAGHGARLDLEGAAGVGRLDAVQTFFDRDGRLKPPATTQQMTDGFAWACEFGRTEVVAFLLQRGIQPGGELKHDGQTGLHWAAYGGHADIVRLLLEGKAPIDFKDRTHGGTPLEWALFAFGNCRDSRSERERYYVVVAALVGAGAKLSPQWFEDDQGHRRAAERVRSDQRMQAALRGDQN